MNPTYAKVIVLEGQSPPVTGYNMLDNADSMKSDLQHSAGTLFCVLLYVQPRADTFSLPAIDLLLRRESHGMVHFKRVGRVVADEVHIEDLSRIRKLHLFPTTSSIQTVGTPSTSFEIHNGSETVKDEILRWRAEIECIL
jgi:hypothetical protein